MESRKKNWNTILNNAIASISLILVTLFLGLCFVVPKNAVKALDKSDIQNYGIDFVSAKTSVRSASGLKKVTLNGRNANKPEETVTFDTYQYVYNTHSENLYYGTNDRLSTTSSSVTLFEKFDGSNVNRANGYIPNGVNYFDNVSGAKEEIFYDEIDDGDYVLLNNNTSHLSATPNSFNVENFYLSIGSPVLANSHSTLLSELRVEGKLYSNGTYHNLKLNTPEQSIIEDGKTAHYWNQYFDMNTLEAYVYNETPSEDNQVSSSTYFVDDVQGKYEITFHFIRYDENYDSPVSETVEIFTYTFYLLDGLEYATYPTINNAEIKTSSDSTTLDTNKSISYYYNFTTANPFVKYDPSKYNISYTRLSNRTITNYSNVTSTFTETAYTDSTYANGKTYPLGIISYYNSSKLFKTVYILTHYNDEKTFVEYLYLSATTSNTNDISTSSLDNFMNNLDKEKLDFEYKISVIREKNDNAYTTTTYRTDKYSNRAFIVDIDSWDKTDYNQVDTYSISLSTQTVDGKEVTTYSLDGVEFATLTKTTDSIENADYYYTLSSNSSLTALDNIIYLENIKLGYSYELMLEELGEYTINYAYVCPANTLRGSSYTNTYFINSVDDITYGGINYSSQSTSITDARDFDATLEKGSETNTDNEDRTLYYTVSGVLTEKDNKLITTINGIDYEYNKTDSKVTVKNVQYEVNATNTTYSPIANVTAYFTVSTIGGRYYLNVHYAIGSICTETTETPYTSSLNGFSNYISKTTLLSTSTYTLNSGLTSESITENKNNWLDLIDVLKAIESYQKDSALTVTTTSSSTQETIQETAKLHIFGSITYFNMQSDVTDSGYAKLQQVDNRYSLNYTADVTSLYTGIVSTDASDFKGHIASLRDKSNIIITDRTPMHWNNFSTLLYNDKKSMSYIYRYENYSFDEDGNINYGTNVISSTYTKDTHCEDNGLYEIVVFYTYDGLPSNSARKNVYYQLFTFIIDKKNPSIAIETVEYDEETNDTTYTDLGSNLYTNKNVKISWEVPSYFKNNVYIDINKTNFQGSDSTYPNFLATYSMGNINVDSSLSAYVNTISSMGVESKTIDGITKQYYYVLLDDKSTSDINGRYNVVVHYDNEGNAKYNANFIIDKNRIDGLNINPVVKDNEGNYKINTDLDFAKGSQIINTDFTFRFNAKASGASIYVYYDKVDLSSTEDYDKLLNAKDGIGITTKFAVSNSISKRTPYSYDCQGGNDVDSNNLLTSNNSGLFIFYLEDEAGNTCRYVVFLDKTEPRFIVSPEPDSTTHTVTDTARVLWGDYKAIKIDSTDISSLEENLNTQVTDYSKETDTDLTLILRYINTSRNFNNLKVEKIGSDFYMLVPITNVTIQDRTYGNSIDIDTTKVDRYYFFTVNPIKENDDETTISLPVYNDATGKVNYESTEGVEQIKKDTYPVKESKITSISYAGKNIERYIEVTYYLDDEKTTTATIYGVFGNKSSSNPRDTYIYNISDKINNNTSGALTVTRDLTDTVAFGLFNYTNNVNKAVCLDETDSAYSVSQLFISSKNAEDLPEFEVTYKHYPYDTSLYNDYNIKEITLLDSSNSTTDQPIEGNETYLKLVMEKKDGVTTKNIYIQLTNAEGYDCPIYSYPYSLESDNQGETDNVYNSNVTYNSDKSRIYSQALNTTTDVNKQQVVTDEGLYIFQRTYTADNCDLGDDNKIAYYVYYVDRKGIIDVSSSSSTADTLYAGSGINYILGSNYSNNEDKTYIDATTIRNSLTDTSHNNFSNSNYTTEGKLFDTNKIQVTLNVAYDKYNFAKFVSSTQSAFNNAISATYDSETKDKIEKLLQYQLFYTDHFQDKIYKTDLQLTIGGSNTSGSTIIDEQNNTYLQNGINKYLSGNPIVSGRRATSLNFFYDVGVDYYNIVINDQAGYLLYNDDGSVVNNYLSNQLKMTFDITHDAPEGNLYGKYYGRQNYDENSSPTSSSTSLPMSNGTYQLISKYLQNGLEPLSAKDTTITNSSNGAYIKVKSTNNETMIFVFTVSENDKYHAQIDPNNIKVYQDINGSQKCILNRVNGNFENNGCVVSPERQQRSFVTEEIEGVVYYSIIIFDNNLDTILDDKDPEEYSQYRLLDAIDNVDQATYSIELHYIGDKDYYKGQDQQGNELSFYNSTYSIIVDRVKPTYNLTKLMALDKYVYNTISETPTSDNYETLFEKYMSVYNFELNEEFDFYRSDLENYYFALDCRSDTTFVFESIDKLDNNQSIYIRLIDKNDYKFSITPDDYKAYYKSTFLQGHPQFTPNNAQLIVDDYLKDLKSGKISIEKDKYYKLQFALDTNNGTEKNTLRASFLKDSAVFQENCYYEIIEEDETGNYRVYAVYIPSTSNNRVTYTYQENSNASSEQIVNILYGNIPYVSSNGMKLKITTINVKDNFLRANITIKTDKITHILNVILDPNDLTVTVINRTTGETLITYQMLSKDSGASANTQQFIQAINYVLDYYYELINNKNTAIYSQYGYDVTIEIVDRTGIDVKGMNTLYNYQINYAVTGSILTPTFKDNANSFTMTLSGQKGSTYLTEIVAYKFNQQWRRISVDNSNPTQSFDLPVNKLKEEIVYTFNRGVYKFVFKDNFNRINEFFYEFGITSSGTVAGGSLDFGDNPYQTLDDGYTYSAHNISYTYDSSAYKVFIKFIGEYYDDISEIISVTDEQNEIVYDSNNIYSASTLDRYGISVVTSGNITTITFHTPNVSTLSKYQIKTILASTSDGYTWGDEINNDDIFVYNKNIAISTAIKDIKITNLSGNYLDTSGKLNLTEDFKLVTVWNSNIASSQRLDFNSRIILSRTYKVNNTIKVEDTTLTSGQTITQAGDYTAYVINDLGMKSNFIYFTRGEGEIVLCAVYAIDNSDNVQTQLSPSSYVQRHESEKLLFSYFITADYLNYSDTRESSMGSINIDNFGEYTNSLGDADKTALSSIIEANQSANKYIDVRINSNLNIKTAISEIGFTTLGYPYVQYQIYADESDAENVYTYRYIQLIFVPTTENEFVDVFVQDASSPDNLAEKNSTIKSTSEYINVTLGIFNDKEGLPLTEMGNTVYIYRYYNGALAETYVLDYKDTNNIPTYSIKISHVGKHTFIIKDLSGRMHSFNGSSMLQIELMNQIEFTTNGEESINNQIFNGSVEFEIDVTHISGLSCQIIKNGKEVDVKAGNNKFTISEAGSYTIKMSANTDLTNNPLIYATYSFTIIDPEIAVNSFNIAKNSNFSIEKIVRTIGSDKKDITNTYTPSGNAVLSLKYEEIGNSRYDITLKKYDEIIDGYRSFSFSVWINDETPTILSSVNAGTSSKETITINYNTGIMYSQIGKGYITLNEQVIAEINSDSELVVDTLTIDKKGTYWLKIYTSDGVLINSYKFVKSEPLNSATKIILVCVAIGIVVVIVLFFLIRRRGKYR